MPPPLRSYAILDETGSLSWNNSSQWEKILALEITRLADEDEMTLTTCVKSKKNIYKLIVNSSWGQQRQLSPLSVFWGTKALNTLALTDKPLLYVSLLCPKLLCDERVGDCWGLERHLQRVNQTLFAEWRFSDLQTAELSTTRSMGNKTVSKG